MHIYKFFTANGKKLALLLSVTLLLTLVLGGTLAFVITRTPSVLNTFVSGLDPTGDLVIRKVVAHPFGDTYTLPDDLSFEFTVGLGQRYAGKTLQTSQGAKTADSSGNLTVTVKAGEAVRLREILVDTAVTVTESDKTGFAVSGNNPKTATVKRGDNEITFTNTYTPAPVSPVNLSVMGTKVLEGRPWQEGDSFTFRLEYKLTGAEAQWQSLGTATVTYQQIQIQDPQFPDDPEKLIWVDKPDFDKFSFTELVQALTYDTAGTYSFRISEVEGTIGGVGYDSIVSYFDVLVGDTDMDGALEIRDVIGYQNAVAAYDETANTFGVAVTVNNTYAPEGTATATIHILKTVTSLSGEEKSPAGYTFQLYDEKGNLVKTSGATSAAGETFIELTFEAKDAGKTFRYLLKETNAGQTLNGMTYDDAEHTIEISVIDDLDGTISAAVALVEQTKQPDQSQTPSVEGTGDKAAVSDGDVEETTEPETTETLTEPETTDAPTEPETTDAPTEPETTDAPTEPETTEAPTEPETTETPTEPETTDAPTEPETTETPTEPETTDAPTEPETTETPTEPETTEETASSDLVDDPNHQTPVTDECYVTFVNTYDPQDTSAAVSGTKKLTGRNLGTGDFTFDLYAVGEDFALAENAKPLQSVPNDGAGSFAFTAIAYDKVGTYRYVVKENDTVKLGGITYDRAVYHITVTVTDENGILTATKTVTDDLGKEAQLIFRNTYAPAKLPVRFGGTKTMTGGELAQWSFDFLLYSADGEFVPQGEPLQKTSSDASGNFRFDEIDLTEANDYYYVIVEDASAAVEGMEYDETVYGIHVSVTDDGVGQLHEVVTYYCGGEKVDAITFHNVYTAPATEPPETTEPTEPTKPVDPDSPPTGDRFDPTLIIVIMVISLAAVVLLIILGNRKKK